MGSPVSQLISRVWGSDTQGVLGEICRSQIRVDPLVDKATREPELFHELKSIYKEASERNNINYQDDIRMISVGTISTDSDSVGVIPTDDTYFRKSSVSTANDRSSRVSSRKSSVSTVTYI